MKRIAALFIIFILLPLFTQSAFCIEKLTDESMSAISGQADTGFSVDNDRTVYLQYDSTIPYNYDENNEQTRYPSSTDLNGDHRSILLDFIGKDTTDRYGNTYREPFYIDVHVENFAYENEDNGAFVVFDGYANGFIQIPEDYGMDSSGNPIYSKTVGLSLSNIPADLIGQTNFICSYQGNTYAASDITETGTTFTIYPNRQAQTVGTATGGDLTILIPYELEDGTFAWGIGAVIPEGKRYVHIDLNTMYERRVISYDLKFSNNVDGINEVTEETGQSIDTAGEQQLRSNTLGTIFVDSSTKVNGGSVFITVNQ